MLFPKKSNKIKTHTKILKIKTKLFFIFFGLDEDCTSLLRISIWKIMDNVVLCNKFVVWYYYFVFFIFYIFMYMYILLIWREPEILHDKDLVIKEIWDLTWYLRWFYILLLLLLLFRELKPTKNNIFNYQDKNKGKEKRLST